MGKVIMVCRTCGSEEVVADAHAEWDVEKQEWAISNVFDKGHYCANCDDECRLDEKPYVEEE